MLTRDQTRLLRVLIIDDELQDRFLQTTGGFATHLEIVPVRSWGDAQLIMARGDLGGADVVLVDISLGQDPLIAKAASVMPGFRMLPVGPLLALPFIGRRAVMSCVVYSSHLANEQLHSHPFFLLAMGLITARTDGLPGNAPHRSKWLDYSPAAGTLDKKVAQMVTASTGNVLTALEEAVEDYRDRLDMMMKDGDVVLTNRTMLSHQLTELLQKGLRERRVALGESRLALTFVGRNWSDRIALRSLFADTLDFKWTGISADWIKRRKDWLASLPESNLERALVIIRILETSDPKGRIVTPDAATLTRKLYGKTLDRSEITELFRLVVLFANAHANVIDESFHRETVYKRLGEAVEQNRYMAWFGERRQTKRSRGAFDSLRAIASGGNKFERCFLQPGSLISQTDRDAICAYLRAEELGDDLVLPYQIEPDER